MLRTLLYAAFIFVAVTARAQQNNDTAFNQYHMRYYRLPGMPDSASFLKSFYNDSINRYGRPPQRKYYYQLLYNPDADLKKHNPEEYKIQMKYYHESLLLFQKDSTRFLQRCRRIDSLQHILDSLQNISGKPALVYQRKN